ncbi:MAG: hypothetical protein IPL35_04775 [Sphingobacteriales bacterium]|nr:hypothetical protein [Sphingobacteriales bacterium]
MKRHLNASTCAWEVSGVEPPAPTNLAVMKRLLLMGVACVGCERRSTDISWHYGVS